MGHFCNLCKNFLGLWNPDTGQGIPNRHGIAEVVDVFRGAGKVNQLMEVFTADIGQSISDKIFNRLHIVSRCCFDLGKGVNGLVRELRHQRAKLTNFRFTKNLVDLQQVFFDQPD